jgi:PEP-CTERM motif
MIKHVILIGVFWVLAATTISAQISPDAKRSVPEPSSLILLLSGLGGGGIWLWRKRK